MRRPNGYGTVTKLSGTRRCPYAVRVPCINRRGHVQQKYLSYHATAGEAQRALDEYTRQAAGGLAPPPDKLSVTLADVYGLWSARKYQKAGPASVSSYKASWGRLRALGGRHMRELTLDELQAVIDRDEKAGLSKSSIHTVVIKQNGSPGWSHDTRAQCIASEAPPVLGWYLTRCFSRIPGKIRLARQPHLRYTAA